jgi:hypothetical protein
MQVLAKLGQPGFDPNTPIVAREVPKPTHEENEGGATEGE